MESKIQNAIFFLLKIYFKCKNSHIKTLIVKLVIVLESVNKAHN